MLQKQDLREPKILVPKKTAAALFYGALSIILRPCKMMDASFVKHKTSRIIFFVPSMAQAFIRGDFSLLIFGHFILDNLTNKKRIQ